MVSAAECITRLNLCRHPEGGYYRETYRATELISKDALPPRFKEERSFSTAIYFLLEGGDFSGLHRIKQDELWHFYAGTPLNIEVIDIKGFHTTHRLGLQLESGELPQIMVKGGELFGACLDSDHGFALVGCTVSPGFEFSDFDMPDQEHLLKEFPQHTQLVKRLTR